MSKVLSDDYACVNILVSSLITKRLKKLNVYM